jgi:hypothetical protein
MAGETVTLTLSREEATILRDFFASIETTTIYKEVRLKEWEGTLPAMHDGDPRSCARSYVSKFKRDVPAPDK